MSQMLELPDEVYEALKAAALEHGLTPAEWLAKQLRVIEGLPEGPLSELLEGLTGIFDSAAGPQQGHQPSPFSAAIAEKLMRQGLKRP